MDEGLECMKRTQVVGSEVRLDFEQLRQMPDDIVTRYRDQGVARGLIKPLAEWMVANSVIEEEHDKAYQTTRYRGEVAVMKIEDFHFLKRLLNELKKDRDHDDVLS
jgi:hypothetical protein